MVAGPSWPLSFLYIAAFGSKTHIDFFRVGPTDSKLHHEGQLITKDADSIRDL